MTLSTQHCYFFLTSHLLPIVIPAKAGILVKFVFSIIHEIPDQVGDDSGESGISEGTCIVCNKP